MLISLDPDQWIVVDDGVMGGRSSGHIARDGGHLIFHGALNTRGGGFTSIRSQSLAHPLNHSDGIAMRVRGDSRRYDLDLRRSSRLSGREATWKAPLPTRPGEWVDVAITFDKFVPTWRGRRITPAPSSTPFWFDVTSLGITIADGIDGPFRLEIAGATTLGRGPVSTAPER
jgi:hypothetical protein